MPYEFDFYQVKAWREERDAKRAEQEQTRQQRINAAQSELFGGQQLAPQGIGDIRETLEAERLAIIVSRQKSDPRRPRDALRPRKGPAPDGGT